MEKMVVHHGGEQVVGGGHRVHVAGQVKGDPVEGDQRAPAAAGRAAFDAEGRAHRALPEGDHGPPADPAQTVAQADGGHRLALAERGGRDRGDHHVTGPPVLGKRIERLQTDLGDALSVRFEQLWPDPRLCGDVADGARRGREGQALSGCCHRPILIDPGC